MKKPDIKTIVFASTYKPVFGKLSFWLLVAISACFILISRNPSGFTNNLAIRISDNIAPIASFIAKPIDSLKSLSLWIDNMNSLESENQLLKAENARLKQWYAEAIELKTENSKLRDLLKFVPAGKSAYISARVATDSKSPYSRSVLITSGSDNNVHEDSAVINERGVIGRVVNVGQKTARVLLLTDINSRIPVMSETSREHSIASGGYGDTLSLMYLPETSKLKVGEKIITSGDGAVLPPGLPVGIVSKIEKGIVTVTPFADLYSLEYVSVIDFSM